MAKIKYFSAKAAADLHGLAHMRVYRDLKKGLITPDAWEIKASGDEWPLFAEVTIKKYLLDIEARNNGTYPPTE